MQCLCPGFTRQLQYVHPSGGFSAFGGSDPSSSTWLTAFCVRYLRRAYRVSLLTCNCKGSKRRPDRAWFYKGRICTIKWLSSFMTASTNWAIIKLYFAGNIRGSPRTSSYTQRGTMAEGAANGKWLLQKHRPCLPSRTEGTQRINTNQVIFDSLGQQGTLVWSGKRRHPPGKDELLRDKAF